MKSKQTLFYTLLSLLLATSLYTYGESSETATKGSKELEQLKALEGQWNADSSKMPGKTYLITYEVTSSGSAVIETLFKGEPFEMITIYSDDEGTLAMNHFCSLKNQPRMKLESTSGNIVHFRYSGGTNIDPEIDAHMHALDLTIIDENTVQHEWSLFKDGEISIHQIQLARIP
ncbi:MAG: hypothetical protein JKY51_03760 [Opitutaceae bacterium]|nr:hypothetical protein [Opitutaceae bacterium]